MIRNHPPLVFSRYIPNVGETLKYAWMQYLALFVPLYFIMEIGRWFVFYFQILPTSVRKDTTPITKLHQF